MKAKKWFNKAVCFKNIGRFWPIWCIYLAVWVFALPVNIGNHLKQRLVLSFYEGPVDYLFVKKLLELQIPAVFITFFFCAFMAMAVFYYLYRAPSVAYYHSLPIRREGLFLSNWLSGIIVFLGCNLIIFIAGLAVGARWDINVLPAMGFWLLSTNAMCIWFYSFACFCAQFTGHIVALPVFYGILSVLPMAVYGIIAFLFEQSVYGITGIGSGAIFNVILAISPPVLMCLRAPGTGYLSDTKYELMGQWDSISYCVLYFVLIIAAAVVFAVLAVLVYRRRHSEGAGDIVTVKPVRPIFKFGLAFCAALCSGLLIERSSTGGGDFKAVTFAIAMIIGGLVFYFVADMLLNKSFKVFAGRNFAKWGIFAAIMLVIFSVGHSTGYGVENRIPPANRVSEASVSFNGGNTQRLLGVNYATSVADTPEEIELIRALHAEILDEKELSLDEAYGDLTVSDKAILTDYSVIDVERHTVHISYVLKNGAYLDRSYAVYVSRERMEEPSTAAGALNIIAEKPEMTVSNKLDRSEEHILKYVFVSQDVNTYSYISKLTGKVPQDAGYSVSGVYIENARAQSIVEAMEKDIELGYLRAPVLLADEEFYAGMTNVLVEVCFEYEEDYSYSKEVGPDYEGKTVAASYFEEMYIPVTAVNTLAALEAAGALDGVLLTTFAEMSAVLDG
ncbi:MAG: hypothetical protein IJP23_07195 [Oscillospiraceae bacterium]|nr:hypothetical protein [Oscillospiraceae bacterium]